MVWAQISSDTNLLVLYSSDNELELELSCKTHTLMLQGENYQCAHSTLGKEKFMNPSQIKILILVLLLKLFKFLNPLFTQSMKMSS